MFCLDSCHGQQDINKWWDKEKHIVVVGRILGPMTPKLDYYVVRLKNIWMSYKQIYE